MTSEKKMKKISLPLQVVKGYSPVAGYLMIRTLLKDLKEAFQDPSINIEDWFELKNKLLQVAEKRGTGLEAILKMIHKASFSQKKVMQMLHFV